MKHFFANLRIYVAVVASGALAAGATPAHAQAIFMMAPPDVAKVRTKESAPGIAAPSFAPFPYVIPPRSQSQAVAKPSVPAPVQAAAPASSPAATAPAPSVDRATPSAPAPVQSVGRAPVAATESQSVSADANTGVVLRHLTNNVQGYRLAGEIGASEWPIYLTEAQVRRKLQFQLGYLAAVSVMPEASTLTSDDQR